MKKSKWVDLILTPSPFWFAASYRNPILLNTRWYKTIKHRPVHVKCGYFHMIATECPRGGKADTVDLKSTDESRGGSNPSGGTNFKARIIALAKQGLTVAEIARVIGATPNQIRHFKHKHKIRTGGRANETWRKSMNKFW